MARQPKYKSGKLFLLRQSLGTTPTKPMSQTTLSEYLEMPFNTLQSTELERRPLTREILYRIRQKTNCVWDDKDGRWLFNQKPLLLQKDTTLNQTFVPATRELVDEYRKAVFRPINKIRRTTDSLIHRFWLDELEERVRDKDWREFSTRISAFVEHTCRELRLGDPIEFFSTATEKAAPSMEAVFKDMTKKMSPKEKLNYIQGEYPELIAGADMYRFSVNVPFRG
jgi:hypothetical protein